MHLACNNCNCVNVLHHRLACRVYVYAQNSTAIWYGDNMACVTEIVRGKRLITHHPILRHINKVILSYLLCFLHYTYTTLQG